MHERGKQRRARDGVGRPIRHGIAAAIFWLLPLLAFAGMLAPGLVQVSYEEEEEEIAQRAGTVLFRPVKLSRPPLMPKDGSTGFFFELLDLESLFNASQFRGELGRKLGPLPSFPSHQGDVIVIDDVDTFVADQFFKDLLKPTFVADRGEIWDPAIFDVIPPLFPIGNDFRYDDFPDPGIDPAGGSVAVPEPGTGALVAMGLIGLAASRGRRPAPGRRRR